MDSRFTWWGFLLVLAGLLTAVPASVATAVAADDDFIVEIWDTDRGLPHSTVTSIAQTPDGYLWIGTLLGGLARFDGLRFVTFHPGNTPELPSIEIQQLLVDTEGTLWVGVVEGSLISRRNGRFQFEREDTQTPSSWLGDVVACRTNEVILSSTYGWLFRGRRDGSTNRWDTFKPPAVSPPGASRRLTPCEDTDGVIWYRRVNSRLARVRHDAVETLDTVFGLKSQQINTLAKDSTGQIWVGTPKELARWDGAGFVNMTPTNGESSLNVQQISPTPDGGMWVLADGKIGKCLHQRWVIVAALTQIQLPAAQRPLQMHPDAQGGIWLMKRGAGMWFVNTSGAISEVGVAQGLPSNLLECWFQDREGNVWVGLSGGGLACVRKRAFHVAWPGDTLDARAARSVCEDASGNLWFGTSGDKVLRWSDGEFTRWSPPADKVAGVDTTVCPDNAGRIWIGTIQNGVWLFETNSFLRPFNPQEVGKVARVLFNDHAGRMWIGNEFGLFCWDGQRLKRFTAADGFTSAYILSIAEDDSHTLWMGTAVGELRSYKNGKFTSYRPPADSTSIRHLKATVTPSNPKSVGQGKLSGGERFWAIYADHQGVLWIGTLGGGLLRFQEGKFTRYNALQGLPNEHVSQILDDGHGQLWLGTRAGISRVGRESLEKFARDESQSVSFITYGKFDGLPTVECSGGYQPGCWKDHKNRLWFTTVKGAVWVDPRKVAFNPLPPPVRIEELWVDGKLIFESDPSPHRTPDTSVAVALPPRNNAAPLRIPAGRHYFNFKFTALSFVSPDKVLFKWRLRGADSDWVSGGIDRSTVYPLLPPGDYEFVVQASNNDGVWNEAGTSLRFSVLPYFWQTWWFRAATVLSMAGLLFLAYSIRIARLRALDHLRLRIARDLHDDVGANLGSISLLAQVMEYSPDAKMAQQVRSIICQTLDTLRDIVWFIDPSHEHLSDLVIRMAETARTMLVSIPYTFDQTGDFRSASLPLDFRRNIMPIFKETLHNVIKHAAATKIEIKVCRTREVFEFTVRDNGRGFDPTNRFSGNGLKNMRRRAVEMNAQFDVSSDAAHGTRVRITAILRAPVNFPPCVNLSSR